MYIAAIKGSISIFIMGRIVALDTWPVYTCFFLFSSVVIFFQYIKYWNTFNIISLLLWYVCIPSSSIFSYFACMLAHTKKIVHDNMAHAGNAFGFPINFSIARLNWIVITFINVSTWQQLGLWYKYIFWIWCWWWWWRVKLWIAIYKCGILKYYYGKWSVMCKVSK